MAYIVATLDACVLIPSAVRDLLLRCDEADLYRCRWSEEILEEVRRNLGNLGVTSAKSERLLQQMQSAFDTAMVAGDYRALTPHMKNDVKDRHVLAAAVWSNSAYLVTDNVSDFPLEAVTPYDIQVVTADQFLCILVNRNPDEVLAVVQARAQQQTKPPETLEEMLAQLEKRLPRFVQLIRSVRCPS